MNNESQLNMKMKPNTKTSSNNISSPISPTISSSNQTPAASNGAFLPHAEINGGPAAGTGRTKQTNLKKHSSTIRHSSKRKPTTNSSGKQQQIE
jgi:hypothetical protein